MKSEQEPTPFSQAIMEYIEMCLQIWPAFRLSLLNIPYAVNPPEGSSIPHGNYRGMSDKEFKKAIATHLHDFIMEHDVKQQHIEQYLEDILAILNVEQQSPATMRYMSNQLIELIQQLQQDNDSRLISLRQTYQEFKEKSGMLAHQQQGSSSGEDEDEGASEGDEDEDIEGMSAEEQEIVPQLTMEEKNELEAEGWTVVTKKKK